jgi:uncharacterized protein YccT (UPF0319 family)
MKFTTLLFSISVLTTSVVVAEVIRPAPVVSFPAIDGHQRTIKSYLGQPMIILLADSPKRGDFRTQLKEMEKSFDRLSIQRTVIAAAFRNPNPGEIQSNIPVITLPDGAQACEAFQFKGKFAIALIGPDGNLDYITNNVLNINRILEVMQNSYEVQKAAHR